MDHLLLQSRVSARCSVKACWGIDQMPLGGTEFLHFYKCRYSHIATASLLPSSLDFGSSTLGYGPSRAGRCPWLWPPPPAVAAALTLARFTLLLHNSENHFPDCGLWTVYNIGIDCDLNVTSGQGGMNPFRKSVASQSAHTPAGVCGVFPFLPSAGSIWDLLGWCYIFWCRCIKNGLIFFF